MENPLEDGVQMSVDGQTPQSRPWWSRRPLLIGGAIALVVVLIAAVAVAFAVTGDREPAASPSPSRSASPTPTPTPTPTAQPVPRSAVAKGTLAGWTLAAETLIGSVHPQAGQAASGTTSLWIDAPVVAAPAVAASTTAAVAPGTDYVLRASVRQVSAFPEPVAASLGAGDARLPLPDLSSQWQEVELEVSTAADQTEMTVGVELGGPVRGLSIDDVTLVPAAGGDNVVPNASFEDVAGEWGVRNDSLILFEDVAALAVQLAPGAASWTATDAAGGVVAQGTRDVRDGLDLLPLDGVPQGYYTVQVADAAGRSVTTPVAVVDVPSGIMTTDPRLGAHINPLASYSVDAAAQAQALGLGAMRGNVTWQYIEKSRDVYTFGDNYVAAFAKGTAHGLGMLAAAGWTNTAWDGGRTPSSTDAVQAFGRYAAALTQNLDLIGVEVYNEFNIPVFNRGGCGLTANCYLPLLQAAHANVKSVAPDVPVVGGATGNYPIEWFDQLWSLGGLASTDAVSYHPYEVYATPESLADIVAFSRSRMSELGGAERPVWITELGWTSKSGDITPTEQGELLLRTEAIALAAGVERFFWYDLVNDSTDPAEHEGNFGLFAQPIAGVASLPPKPAAFAQALLNARIAAKPFTGRDALASGDAWSVAFGDGDEATRAVWTIGDATPIRYRADETVTVTSASGAVSWIAPTDGIVEIVPTSTVTFVEGVLGVEGAVPDAAPSPSPSATEGARP